MLFANESSFGREFAFKQEFLGKRKPASEEDGGVMRTILREIPALSMKFDPPLFRPLA